MNSDMFCCGLALQRSGGGETARHAEISTASSDTEDRGAVQYHSKVSMH